MLEWLDDLVFTEADAVSFYAFAVTAALAHDVDNCTIMVRAGLVAAWVGAGRPVTAKGVLRPGDIPPAAAAMGVAAPPRARTAADVEVLHRPWVAAQAIGLIAVDAGRATAAAGPAGDRLEAWWVALIAVLRSESHDRRGEGAVMLCRTLLTVLDNEPAPAAEELEDAVHERLHELDGWQLGAVFEAFRRGVTPVEAGLEVLAEFGAVDATARLTSLGRWASRRFAAISPQSVSPDLPAAELLTRLASLPDQDVWQQVRRWLAGRDLGQAVSEVLAAAVEAKPAARVAGIDLVGGLGEAMRPVWQAALDQPMLAPHARAVLAAWDETEPDEADHCWLAVEYALASEDIEEAYHLVEDFGGMAIVTASDHPGAPGLRDTLTAAERPPRRVYQLKIALSRVKPPVWRRLRVPATITLDLLHQAIQVAFDWDDDHLHIFETDRNRYADPEFVLDDCDDESAVRLAKAMPNEGTTMTYVYDLGDWWEHRITVERIDEMDDLDVIDIVCTEGRGDAPIEDWNPEDGPGAAPFDVEAVNRRLAALLGASNMDGLQAQAGRP
ncbi:plasmid pRiA4b ORF-3 family protein [Dactylosporangium salmoneum]|uniref:Plasmid pRiA4b Orf3-like domain-containing protein n=1 Tax=Dactylosporangium salmoneum TaxID=53361 RepID=A0ABP5UDZ5_9ACTN